MAFDPLNKPIDYFLLNNVRSPGLAEIVGAASVRLWDERKGFGLNGAISVFKGRALSKFSAKIRLITEQDWADWQAWKPIIDKLPTRRGGNTPDSGNLDIWHPVLEDLNIKSVGVVSVSQPEQTDNGEFTIKIDFIEYRRPTVGLAKPEGSKATPVDPYDQKIEALTGQLQRLANE